MTRDWTEAEARAWLRASLPKGWRVRVGAGIAGFDGKWAQQPWVTCDSCGEFLVERERPALRSACRALIRAAKRAGIAVNQVQEPGGK